MLINPDFIYDVAHDPRLPHWIFEMRHMIIDCDGFGAGVEVPEEYWSELMVLAVLDARIYAEESRN